SFIHLIFIFTACYIFYLFFFFFNDTSTTEIYTLSLHDALPIFRSFVGIGSLQFLLFYFYSKQVYEKTNPFVGYNVHRMSIDYHLERKSTRLNSSHVEISYAVFCLKKKKKKKKNRYQIKI